MRALLALEDGTVFSGRAFGARGEVWGEVVFATAMTGYQEVLTDPSYCGQIVVLTYPLAGNYGINLEDNEAGRVWVRGLVVREYCPTPSNWRSTCTLAEFLQTHGVPGIEGVDTRALTRRLREHGSMRGVISTEDLDPESLVAKARLAPSLSEEDLVSEVVTRSAYTIPGEGPRVVVVDFGVKQSILRQLRERGCELVVVPPTSSAQEILALAPQGVLLSNGPGDPSRLTGARDTVKALLGRVPLMGICLGHQVAALSLGARTFKLKFGHHGINHPVKDLATGRVFITSHNHGFAVDPASLPPELEVSYISLNDGTVEGLRHKFLPFFSVQFHPEGGPGPQDAAFIFDRFLELLQENVGR
ncbi:carbamoyl-phosphate synthase, small subunit [Ammonifex degensii KC4]|uniref:Carbamoyl phosphate synthase small chain n=1 Tax=Ammonifex degensii (strain DSM 10501 / KC4) TaxID=429009 RepID=C9RB99_AMMDK|nr:glutamine-hydrolyzing carbamoyl-phosphate synthase small subunit [Ammonifex degensii]ACX51526.1 carbamoyl-phosphate synthase, small subunit [Ammonifex degensii KC4]